MGRKWVVNARRPAFFLEAPQDQLLIGCRHLELLDYTPAEAEFLAFLVPMRDHGFGGRRRGRPPVRQRGVAIPRTSKPGTYFREHKAGPLAERELSTLAKQPAVVVGAGHFHRVFD
jgi:hypothetical protein